MIQYDQFIQYGSVKHGAEFQRLHQRAKEVAWVASFLARAVLNRQIATTSIYRIKTNDSGIHETFRAIDFAPLPTLEETYWLIDKINGLFIYDSKTSDPKRIALKVAAENPFHGTGIHIHIQVHDNTSHISEPQRLAYLIKADHDKAIFQPKPLGVTT